MTKIKKASKNVEKGNKEKEEEQNEKNTQMEKRVKFLEDGFYSSKFSLKVTHATATTLQLLA